MIRPLAEGSSYETPDPDRQSGTLGVPESGKPEQVSVTYVYWNYANKPSKKGKQLHGKLVADGKYLASDVEYHAHVALAHEMIHARRRITGSAEDRRSQDFPTPLGPGIDLTLPRVGYGGAVPK